jgi:predicted transcriptional regulator of viral defense system
MEALEELTAEKVKALTMEEAQELFEERKSLISRIRTENEILMEKIKPGKPMIRTVPECEKCSSKNLRYRTNGTYFCPKCGYSSGQP